MSTRTQFNIEQEETESKNSPIIVIRHNAILSRQKQHQKQFENPNHEQGNVGQAKVEVKQGYRK